MTLTIAMLQLLPTGSADEQLKKGLAACEKAAELGADIALFPEMWSDGYYLPQEEGAADRLAIGSDHRRERQPRDPGVLQALARRGVACAGRRRRGGRGHPFARLL